MIHEVGHALYEQGLNRDQDGLPVQRALSMGVHESQSLFWERYVGQSLEFWEANLGLFHERYVLGLSQIQALFGPITLTVYSYSVHITEY